MSTVLDVNLKKPTPGDILQFSNGFWRNKPFVNVTGGLRISEYPGVDKTGVLDSLEAVRAAMDSIAGTNNVLIIDCPVKLAIGHDYTKPIFVNHRTNLTFTQNGEFIVDNTLIPVFAFHGTTDCTWINTTIKYIGTNAIDYTAAPYTGVAQSFNDSNIKAWLIANRGNTFTSRSAVWWGPTESCAIFMLRGQCNNLTFRDTRVYVPDGALAVNFAPHIFTMNGQWKTGLTGITSGTLETSANVAVPTNIDYDGLELDGYFMGVQGAGDFTLSRGRFYRYADLQDAAGANIGGVGGWFAPPHAIYCNSYVSSSGGYTAPLKHTITDVIDFGIYVGNATRRSASGSGTLCSLKVEPANNSTIINYSTYRPDGVLDILGNGSENGIIKGLYGVYDSSVVCAAGNVFGIRWPSGSYKNLHMEATIVDTAVTPTGFPIGGSGAANQDIFLDLKVSMNDWPAGATWAPGLGTFKGTNVNINLMLFLDACNATQTFRGCVSNASKTGISNQNYNVIVNNWRLFDSTNIDSLKQRILLCDVTTNGNRARVVDTANGYEAHVQNGVKTEYWTQKVTVTPIAGAAFHDTTIIFPATFSIDAPSAYITTAFGNSSGLTTIDLGWSGAATALYAALARAAGSSTIIPAGYVSLGGSARTIRITPSAGTFDGTGVMQIAVRGVRTLASE